MSDHGANEGRGGTGASRFALYYQPEADEALARAGAGWLAGQVLDHDPWPGWLASPARYGFHATLKAPFRLIEGATANDLADWAMQRAALMDAFELPALEPQWFGEFLALRPRDGDPPADSPLRCLADEWVAVLEPWRAELDAHEIARRDPARLSAVQARNLRRWGYPAVFDAWRFHMTLSGPAPAGIDARARARLLDRARMHFAGALARPVYVQSVCVCVQARQEEPFAILQRLPLRGFSG
ncbi:MAG: DUF1045 domain-containing protein [Burkholderiaceae bacterium]